MAGFSGACRRGRLEEAGSMMDRAGGNGELSVMDRTGGDDDLGLGRTSSDDDEYR